MHGNHVVGLNSRSVFEMVTDNTLTRVGEYRQLATIPQYRQTIPSETVPAVSLVVPDEKAAAVLIAALQLTATR